MDFFIPSSLFLWVEKSEIKVFRKCLWVLIQGVLDRGQMEFSQQSRGHSPTVPCPEQEGAQAF